MPTLKHGAVSRQTGLWKLTSSVRNHRDAAWELFWRTLDNPDASVQTLRYQMRAWLWLDDLVKLAERGDVRPEERQSYVERVAK